MERHFASSYLSVALWGLAVLFGMIGFGRLIARAIDDEAAAKAGWGLHAVWGMAVYLFAGGILALFGAGGQMGITLLIAVGLAGMIWTTVRAGWPTKASFAALPWQAWPAFAVVALVYAGGLFHQGNIEPCDDFAAYYNFCEKLLSTGSFEDPFSWRRLASLGGHTMLQCSVLAHGCYANAQAFEIALCPVILLGLILGFREGALARSPFGLLLSLVAVTTPILRANTASYLTGVVLFMGLFVTLNLAETSAARRSRWLAIAGLVAAGLCSLRAQYVPAAGGALGLFWLVSWVRDRRALRAALVEGGCWGGALLLGLLPWMAMGFLSNGSPLFPLFQGGNNLAFNPQALAAPPHARLLPLVQMLLTPVLVPLLLAMLAAPAWRRGGLAARVMSISAVVAALLLAYGVNLAPDPYTIPRYVQPLLLAAALAALLAAAVVSRRRVVAWAMVCLLMTTSIPARCDQFLLFYMGLGCAEKIIVPYRVGVIADYREAQLLVPEGRRILVCGDYPFLFDHERNPIWIIDLPHGTSPAPGLPFQQPAEATKRYLRGLGVDYLIFTDFTGSSRLYNRPSWQKHADGNVPLWKIQAPFYLDFFDTVDRLAATETKLGKVGTLTAIQLNP